MAQIRHALNTRRDDDFAAWYQDVISSAEMAEESGVRGCMVIRPWGFGIWERMQRLLDDGKLDPEHYRRLFIHVIDAQDEMMRLGESSKMNAEWDFLHHLFKIGRQTTDRWLTEAYDQLGTRSTVDTRAMFQGLGAQHHG